jgi:hypothetical protein
MRSRESGQFSTRYGSRPRTAQAASAAHPMPAPAKSIRQHVTFSADKTDKKARL